MVASVVVSGFGGLGLGVGVSLGSGSGAGGVVVVGVGRSDVDFGDTEPWGWFNGIGGLLPGNVVKVYSGVMPGCIVCTPAGVLRLVNRGVVTLGGGVAYINALQSGWDTYKWWSCVNIPL